LISLPKLSRPKQILLDFFLVFLFTAVLIRPYFKAKYTDKWASIESTFIGLQPCSTLSVAAPSRPERISDPGDPDLLEGRLNEVVSSCQWSTAPIRDWRRTGDFWVPWKYPVSKQLQFKFHSCVCAAAFLQTALSKAPV